MRVVLDGRLIQDHFPGIGRSTAALVRWLPEVAAGLDLIVLRDPNAPNRRFDWADLTRAGARIVDRPVGVFSPVDQLTFAGQARRWGADLYHFPYPVRPYLLPRASVVTIHDTIPLRHPDLLPGPRDRWLFPWLLRLAAAASRIVLTVSAAARADLIDLLRVPAAKIRVTPNCVEPPPAGVGPPPLAGPYLLTVGINKPHKNLPRLIEAYAASRVAWPLAIAGPIDPRYPEARRAAERLGVAGRVHWLGYVGEAELAAAYAGAAIVLFPSLAEGFGLPALEAMAAGVPLIASALPALREVAAGAARLIDPTDVAAWAAGIADLAAAPAERERLAAAGRARAAEFSPRRTAELVAAAYREAIAG